MLLQQVQLTVVQGREAAFEAALLEVRQRVFASSGFRGLAVHQGLDQPSTYLVQIRWESHDELAAFAGSDRMERCFHPVAPHLARPPRIDHWTTRPGLDLNGPGVLTDLAWMTD